MALTDKLTDIADAIRAKTGDNDPLTLTQMADAIEDLEVGGGGVELPNSLFVIPHAATQGLFANNQWQYLVENYPNKWVFPALGFTKIDEFLQGSNYNWPSAVRIPVSNARAQFAFSSIGDTNVTALAIPYIDGSLGDCTSMFSNSYIIIPNDWFDTISLGSYTTSYTAVSLNMMFYNTVAKQIIDMGNLTLPNDRIISNTTSPAALLPFEVSTTSYSKSIVDGFANLPVGLSSRTGTRDSTSILQAPLCKKITFKKVNNAAQTANWNKLILDLSTNVGYDTSISANSTPYIYYWFGLTLAQNASVENWRITDATSYAALANEPNRWTHDPAYSLYNKASAIETIDSLPDVSGTTNGATIKFKGDAGSATTEGAINTMTAAEIAVATAKGWTVTLV